MATRDDLERLVEHVFRTAREMVEKHGDFNPFGAIINEAGEVRSYGGEKGVDHPDRQKIYLLMRAGFAKDAAEGKVRASALVAMASPPKEARARFAESIAVTAEAPGRALRLYLPFRRTRVLGIGPERTVWGERVSTEIESFVFLQSVS